MKFFVVGGVKKRFIEFVAAALFGYLATVSTLAENSPFFILDELLNDLTIQMVLLNIL